MKFLDELGLHYLMGKLNGKFNLKADKTYVDSRVKTVVPADARFTDTVYSHPATHPASMINLEASSSSVEEYVAFNISQMSQMDKKKANKTQIGTDVPSGALFTDTKTTINGNTGVITKEDIVALGIPAQDTVVNITNKVDKISGKGLSTNDYTAADKGNLNSNTASRHTHANLGALNKITEDSQGLKYNNEIIVTQSEFTWGRLANSMSWGDLAGK